MGTITKMRPDVRAEIVTSLKRDYQFKEVKGYLRQGVCPSCGEKELFVSADAPWHIRCGRYNNCGWESSTRDLYPDAFGRFNERFPPTTEDPNATADAYMTFERGLTASKFKGFWRQGTFSHPKGNRKTATVVFDIDRETGVFMERLIDPVTITKEDGTKDTRKANFVGSHLGNWWAPPGLNLDGECELWIVEGCIDAITLMSYGLKSVAILSASHFPETRLKELDPKKITLIWALDNDHAGNTSTLRHIKRARDMGFLSRAAVIPQKRGKKTDWNDAHKAGQLAPLTDCDGKTGENPFNRFRFHGDLLTATSAVEKGCIIWSRTQATNFAVEFDRKTYWYTLAQEQYAKQLEELRQTGDVSEERGQEFHAAMKTSTVHEIANCSFKFLYFLQSNTTDESWYYAQITFPHGRNTTKNTFTGPQVSAGSEFKKRLLSISPGALWTGTTPQLNWIIKRYMDDIRIVDTVEFVGYSKQHAAWIFNNKAVSRGQVYKLNDEDFFEIGSQSVKSLNASIPLIIGEVASYNKRWIDLVYRAFGPKGIIAAAFYLGSFFAEQIRDRHKSFPFIEIVGEAGAGKSTLIEFLWKLCGRNDYEGFDPNKATQSARARIMSQVSNLPVCMIESDRGGEDSKVKQFDWDELKTAYNGRSPRATGVKNGGNDTKEPPFRGSIIISQNKEVQASPAIMQRIVHLHFDCSGHSATTKQAADDLASIPVEHVSHFVIQAIQAEDQVMKLFNERAPVYEAQLMQMDEIQRVRLAKNHGQMMALVDALHSLVKLPEGSYEETMLALKTAAVERQRAIADDPPVVQEFWETVDYIGLHMLNHSRDEGLIAISLPHFQQQANTSGLTIPVLSDLKKDLALSSSKKFVGYRAVNSGLSGFKTVKCWVFKNGGGNV